MENTQLTLADLASIHSIIEAACSRGAFRAQEMTTVGIAFDKLSRFLEASAAAGEAPSADADNNAQGDQSA